MWREKIELAERLLSELAEGVAVPTGELAQLGLLAACAPYLAGPGLWDIQEALRCRIAEFGMLARLSGEHA